MNRACPTCDADLLENPPPVPINEKEDNRIGKLHFCSEECRDEYRVEHDYDDDLVRACPRCDSSKIYERPGWQTADWKCRGCDNDFDEPTERPAKQVGLKGLAKQLHEADKDDVGGDQR